MYTDIYIDVIYIYKDIYSKLQSIQVLEAVTPEYGAPPTKLLLKASHAVAPDPGTQNSSPKPSHKPQTTNFIKFPRTPTPKLQQIPVTNTGSGGSDARLRRPPHEAANQGIARRVLECLGGKCGGQTGQHSHQRCTPRGASLSYTIDLSINLSQLPPKL